MTGTVKWFSNEKGYGFLVSDQETPTDYFFHGSALVEKRFPRSIPEGARVEFEIGRSPKGPCALSVREIP